MSGSGREKKHGGGEIRTPLPTRQTVFIAELIKMAATWRYFHSSVDGRRRNSLFLPDFLSAEPPMRRLLEDSTQSQPPMAVPGDGAQWGDSNFDSNMVIVLAALLLALISAFALNSLLRYALRRERSVGLDDQRPAGRGLMKRTLREMPMGVYGQAGLHMGDTDCPICLGEFTDGEKVRVLPRCNHGFHVRCIDAWLVAQPSCPSCRRSILDTSGCDGDGITRQRGDFV